MNEGVTGTSFNLYHKVAKINVLDEESLSESSNDESEVSDESDENLSAKEENGEISDKEVSNSSDEENANNENDSEISDIEDDVSLSGHSESNENEEDSDSLRNLQSSDFDKDTFGDIALEGIDSDDDSNDDQENENRNENSENESQDQDLHEPPNRMKVRKKIFQKSAVDSKFLNLRESEWVADSDIIGKSFDDNIDMMQNISDEEDNDISVS